VNETLDCEEARISLGVYVLGAIDLAEQAAVDAHLADCAVCRAELVGLDRLPALLGMVSAEDAAGLAERESGILPALSADPDRSAPDPASLSAARNRRDKRGWVRIAVASTAAAVLVALTGLGGAILGSHQAQPGPGLNTGAALGPWRTATGDGAAGMRATVRYRTVDWGTEVTVMVAGIPVHTACSIEAVGPEGTEAMAGSWITDGNEGRVWYTAGTGLSGDQLSKFVVTIAGRPAITIAA
jgi:anti-sigma factor RsiW